MPQLDTTQWVMVLVVVAAVLTLKGFALYRAGANRDKGWFAALFILNTAGILELVYLLAIAKRKK
ncbi:MAG: DUF5652 family protein [Micrococcales bacterium]